MFVKKRIDLKINRLVANSNFIRTIMMENDIFDEIIGFLSEEGEISRYADIDGDLLEKFNSCKSPGAAALSKSKPMIRESDVPSDSAGKKSDTVTYAESSSKSHGDKRKELEDLAGQVTGCRNCRLHLDRKNTVFGSGNPDAKLMFIGEGPGADEDEQGLPFVGLAGQLLTKMITAIQFDRQDVYIANIVKCRSPGNRNPFDDEATQCLGYLQKQIEIIRPEVLVLLGAVPLKFLVGKTGITRIHGNWLEYKGIRTIPTFHPAYLLRNPSVKKDAWDDLQKVMQAFGKVYRKSP